jgi:DNA-binding transcriptional ArsR family regulator
LCTFNELVEHSGKASSTVSWYLKRLREAGIISVRNTEYQLYCIENVELVSEVLDKYRESFIDAAITNYSQMIEEL